MADAEHKDMKTIIFFSTCPEDHVRSIEELNIAFNADERCHHKIFFRPIMPNVFQFIKGDKDEDGNPLFGCREILYLPITKEAEIQRLEATKNVALNINCMCFVGNNDKKQLKKKKIIDWMLEETEEIQL